MPCDQVRTVTVKFGIGTDVKLLQKAIESLGYTVTPYENILNIFSGGAWVGKYESGNLEMPEAEINPIKKAYSTNVVHATAARYGWGVEESKTAITVTRRGI